MIFQYSMGSLVYVGLLVSLQMFVVHLCADSFIVSPPSAPGSRHGLGFIIWQNYSTKETNATTLEE